MIRSITPAALCLLLFLLAACEGPTGPPGRDGVTDVYSYNFTFFFEDTERSGAVASEQYTRFEIPQSVVRDGAVLVYFFDEGTWTALPLTIGLEAPDDPPRVDYTVTFGYAYERNFLELFFEASTEDEVVWEEIADIFEGGIEMKAVIIDSYLVGKTGVDLTDYEEVKVHFGLDD